METRTVGKWTVEAAEIRHTVRRSQMSGVLDAYLKDMAKAAEIDDYKAIISAVQAEPVKYDTIGEAERDFYDRAAGLGMWVAIAACASPYISIREWQTLSDDEISKLSDAAMELNPHWFGEKVTPALEKKSRPRHKKTLTA